MKALKFKLSGKSAFFKLPEVNNYVYFTYGNIHKVALLGIFGAILGYKGYIQKKEEEPFPEFYEKLHQLNVSIVPNCCKTGSFNRTIQTFNNSVGYASKEKGGNLIVKQQWLENPEWYIYVAIDCEEAELLAQSIVNKRCKYIPYLGSNNHPANIDEAEIVNCEHVTEINDKVDSLYPDGEATINAFPLAKDKIFRYGEFLPVGLEKFSNLYKCEKLIYTNGMVKHAACTIYQSGKHKIVFI